MPEPLFNSSLREGKSIAPCALCKKHFDTAALRSVELLAGFPAARLCPACLRRCGTENIAKRLEIMNTLYPDRKEDIAAVMLPPDYRPSAPPETPETKISFKEYMIGGLIGLVLTACVFGIVVLISEIFSV